MVEPDYPIWWWRGALVSSNLKSYFVNRSIGRWQLEWGGVTLRTIPTASVRNFCRWCQMLAADITQCNTLLGLLAMCFRLFGFWSNNATTPAKWINLAVKVWSFKLFHGQVAQWLTPTGTSIFIWYFVVSFGIIWYHFVSFGFRDGFLQPEVLLCRCWAHGIDFSSWFWAYVGVSMYGFWWLAT